MDWLWEPLEYVGETLVFLGVAGEVLADRKLILKGDDVRRRTFEGFASVILIIGLALSLGALIGTNGHFNGTIANLNSQAAESNKKAGEANKEAERLRLRADELEEQLLEQGPRDRLLNGKRKNTFINSIREFKQQKVQVRICQFDNDEVRDTAERLTALFKEAEWVVSSHSPNWGEGNCGINKPNARIASGIWVGTPGTIPTARARERAKKLVAFLNQIPLVATLHQVRPETARGSQSRESIQGRYDDSDSIVVVVLTPSFEEDKPSLHVGPAGIVF